MVLRFAIFIQLFLGHLSFGKGLPKHFLYEGMGINQISSGNSIPLNLSVKIPDGYKINYSPKLDVYEKVNKDWVLVQSIKEKDLPFLRKNNTLRFGGNTLFRSGESEVALDLTLSFCKKICVINNFQSRVQRNLKKSNEPIQIAIRGYLPHEKVDKKYKKSQGPSKVNSPAS